MIVAISWKCQRGQIDIPVLLKQARIIVLHFVEMSEQHFGKGITASKAKKPGKTFQVLAFCGQGLRLLIVHHLQAVFNRPKKAIGLLHCVTRRFVDPLILAQLVKCGECIAVAQGRISAARNQLLGLRKKFDFADSAATKFDVVAFDRNFAVPAIGVNLSLHRVNVCNCGKVEIFAPYEWGELIENRHRPPQYRPRKRAL